MKRADVFRAPGGRWCAAFSDRTPSSIHPTHAAALAHALAEVGLTPQHHRTEGADMTTDDFTTAAREEAVKAGIQCPVHGIPDCSPLLNGCSIPTKIVQGRVHMAEWARAHLDHAEGEALRERDAWEERLTNLVYSLATVEEVGEWSSGNELDQTFIDHMQGKIQRLEREPAEARAHLAEQEHRSRCKHEKCPGGGLCCCAQEPTDAEVLAVLNSLTGREETDLRAHYDNEVDECRRALSAARRARGGTT